MSDSRYVLVEDTLMKIMKYNRQAVETINAVDDRYEVDINKIRTNTTLSDMSQLDRRIKKVTVNTCVLGDKFELHLNLKHVHHIDKIFLELIGYSPAIESALEQTKVDIENVMKKLMPVQ